MFFSSTLTGEEHISCDNVLGRQLSLEPRDQQYISQYIFITHFQEIPLTADR